MVANAAARFCEKDETKCQWFVDDGLGVCSILSVCLAFFHVMEKTFRFV